MGLQASTRAPGSPFPVPPPEVRAACEARLREAEGRRAEALARQRLAASGVPERFRCAALADCDPAVREWARAALAGGGGGDAPFLLLLGRNGRGKSHQACAALMALAPAMGVLYAEAPEFAGACSEDYGRGAAAEVARLAAAPALVLDELGKEPATARTAAWVFEVLNRRWKRRRPTVACSNMDSDGLAAHYARIGEETMGQSIISRLGSGAVVRLEGRDRRFSAAPGRAEP